MNLERMWVVWGRMCVIPGLYVLDLAWIILGDVGWHFNDF